MSDDRIFPTPTPSRCPVCTDAIASSSSGACPACGKTSLPATPFAIPDLRHRSEEWLLGYDRPVFFGFGILSLFLVAFFAYVAPGALFFFAVLLVPAGIRTVRLMTRPDIHEVRSFWGYLLGAAIASFGVAVLTGTASASAIAFCIVLVITVAGSDPNPLWIGLGVGLILAPFVFLAIFIKFWPRDRSDEMPRSPDPEN